MKPQPVLIDTGPIVAILSEADEYHERCTAELANLRPPLLTCWPVVTEAQWLLRHDPIATAGLFRAFENKLLALLPLDETALPWLDAFLRRYRKIAPDLADAASSSIHWRKVLPIPILHVVQILTLLLQPQQQHYEIVWSGQSHRLGLTGGPMPQGVRQ